MVPITSLPERTRVVTRPSRLLSAWTTTDCLVPTCTTTLLEPARSTPVNGRTERTCVAATPEPVPAGLLEPWKKIRSTSSARRIALTKSTPRAVSACWRRLAPLRRWIAVRAAPMVSLLVSHAPLQRTGASTSELFHRQRLARLLTHHAAARSRRAKAASPASAAISPSPVRIPIAGQSRPVAGTGPTWVNSAVSSSHWLLVMLVPTISIRNGPQDERVEERHGESRRDAEQQRPQAEDEQGGWR